MQAPNIFIAYEPGVGLHCALAYLRSGADAYGWFTGRLRNGRVASRYFLLERFYANAPDRYEAVHDAELHSAWTLDEARRHELARMQAQVSNEWLREPERLERFSRAHRIWTFYSPGFERPVLKHLARHWPLAYRLGAESAAAAQRRRLATRARP
jgi:hypothetical protein